MTHVFCFKCITIQGFNTLLLKKRSIKILESNQKKILLHAKKRNMQTKFVKL